MAAQVPFSPGVCHQGEGRVGRDGGWRRRRGRIGGIGPRPGGAAGSGLAAEALPGFAAAGRGGEGPPGPRLRPAGWVGLPQPPSSPDNVSAARPRPAALSKREPRRRGKRGCPAARPPAAGTGWGSGSGSCPRPSSTPGAVRGGPAPGAVRGPARELSAPAPGAVRRAPAPAPAAVGSGRPCSPARCWAAPSRRAAGSGPAAAARAPGGRGRPVFPLVPCPSSERKPGASAARGSGSGERRGSCPSLAWH